jgi:23S rRNA pseudouridine1911/1915/1917 synthase
VNASCITSATWSGIGGEIRPGIARLDRGTSGMMVIAKRSRPRRWRASFTTAKSRRIHRARMGLAQAGRRIDAPIGRDPSNRQKMSAKARRARSAVTRVTKAIHMKGVTLIHVAIATGRTHQIRVHLSAIGHPIVGDPLYGGVHRRVPGSLHAVQRLERPFLHAARLAFTHPVEGRRMEFVSPLPDDLQDVLDQLSVDAAP